MLASSSPPIRKRLVVVAAIGLAAALVGFWKTPLPANTSQEYAMTALTTGMKTMCFGRYLVEVPAAAELSIGDAYSESVKIERTAPYRDEQAFRDYLQEHEQRLRVAKHETEGSLWRETKVIDGGGQLFLSRPEARRSRTTVVEYFHRYPSYRLSYLAADEDVDETSILIARLRLHLRPRSNSVPTTPGACISDGLIDFIPTYNERFYAGARMESPSWALSIKTDDTGPTEPGKDLHSRVDAAIAMAGPAGASIRKLRRGTVTVDGRKGREYIGVYPQDRGGPDEIFDAKLEVEGSGKPQQPTIKLHMEAVWPRKREPSDTGKHLTQEEALALWDAIVKSVRMRPGAF